MTNNQQDADYAAFYYKNGEQLAEAQFKIQSINKYMDLFQELQNRSDRAAKMHYYIAADYDKKAFQLRLAVAIGIICLVTCPLYYHDIFAIVGALSFAVVFVTNLSNDFSWFIRLPLVISDKAKEHTAVAARWQTLELKIRSYMIQLTDPKVTCKEYTEWWNNIIEERRELCLMYIPVDVYRKFPSQYSATRSGY